MGRKGRIWGKTKGGSKKESRRMDVKGIKREGKRMKKERRRKRKEREGKGRGSGHERRRKRKLRKGKKREKRFILCGIFFIHSDQYL